MKLTRFKERKQKKIGMVVGISSIVLLLTAIIIYRTYSIYQEKQEFDVIRGSVPDQNYDVMFTFYLLEQDGTKKVIETIPEGKEYTVHVECNHDALGSWDRELWGPIITNLTNTRTKCNITFEKAIAPLKEYGIEDFTVKEGNGIYEVPHEDASITYTSDETAIANLKKTEYRYAGSNPNNYVTFNGEVAGWRLIGLVNTPEGQRLKLIRHESIGNYSWDSSVSAINNGDGINEWSQADVKNLLNSGAYFKRMKGTCYSGLNNKTVSCDFSQNGLTEESKQMIDTITWNTGSNGKNGYSSSTNGLTKHFYNYERSNSTGKICSGNSNENSYYMYCNDTVVRKSIWQGQVGLMYLSDYGYATSGGEILTRDHCLNKELITWNEKDVSDCKDNNYLYLSSNRQWSMVPVGWNYRADTVFDITPTSTFNTDRAENALSIRPAIYLILNIKIVNGDGTKENPYLLGTT